MRRDVWQYVQANPMLRAFVREQPRWYRLLARRPHELSALQLAALRHYGQTIPDKVGKISQSLQMASLMWQMFKALRD
ncbi:YlbE-like family protein [Geobacillus stearothermophilus]|uniref:YlbE-like family protein n=1 Tax=Geobacillus stearothermophilus TaxID=1422 RepID=UPI002E214EEB|nr:YlbE-like family protein [Geobacillus stearothermophilus]MED4870940.1 YlbE-like family protein [Geobacillus stearothermophilus]MED4985762.1 YlbE-like family protein [Geobacillus stearothermophilus]